MRRSLALAALIAAVPVFAPAEPVDLDMITRIREEGFTSSRVMDTLAYLTDVIGPRLTGSSQLKQANEWTKDQLRAWGLVNAHLESWGPFGRGWTLEKASVHMVSPGPAPLLALPRAWTPGTDGPQRGKAIKVRIESEADAERYKGTLGGRVVLMGDPREVKAPVKAPFARYSEQELQDIARFEIARSPRFDRETLLKRIRLQKALRDFLVAEKALATLEPSDLDAGAVRVGRGGSFLKGDNPGVPALVMAAESYNRIARLLDRGLEVELELDVRTRFQDEGDGLVYNTVAEIPGTDRRGEVVMLGAHLDSWHGATGATDNAAGVAVAMEAMRILQALGVKPRRTIRVALWTGEEQGLLGSKAYVRDHFGTRAESTNPLEKELPAFLRRYDGAVTVKPDHARLSAYFNLDNGTGKVRGIYAERNAAVVPIFEAWLRPLHDLGATTVTMRESDGSDHESFDAVGLPGFQFVQDEADYSTRTHHTNLDVLDRIQKTDMMQASVVMATFAYHAATRDAMLPRKPLPRPTPAPSPSASPAPSPRP